MNRKYFIGVGAIIALVALCSFQFSSTPIKSVKSADELLKIVEDIPTAQAFLSDPVPEEDLQRIVNAGVNAPSAMNRQPWHFTVINNAETIKQLADAQKEGMKGMKFPPRPSADGKAPGNPPMPPMGGNRPKMPGGNGPKSGLGDSPVVILISCKEGSEFDAGLACECMNDMANMLGYGTKIASSVTMLFNGDKKAEYDKQFQIPDGQNIVAAILIGKLNTEAYDAVTSATPRNSKEQVVTFVK